jgi:DNA-binding response OmpR family regulator
LLVEGDARLSSRVQEYLERRGLSVSVEPRGDRAESRILSEMPDLVVLDQILPGKDGRSVCRDVRASFPGPILMLSALSGETDQIIGLEVGADDYLPKPVSPDLLLSRIHALLRLASRARNDGSGAGPRSSAQVVNSIAVDPGSRTVTVDGREVALTTAEFDLLHFLARHAGKVQSRDRIYREVRGIEYDGVDRSIDLRIARLRRKLGDSAACPRFIKSVHGEGYMLVVNP